MIAWFLAHDNVFVWASLALNVGSTVVYCVAGNPAKAVYFSGAVVLTIGVLMMK